MRLDYNVDRKTDDELKFVEYLGFTGGVDKYLLKLIKNIDGVKKPSIEILDDFRKPNWVTKPMYANHVQKKEYAPLSNLEMFMCTKRDEKDLMYSSVLRSTGSSNAKAKLRKINKKNLIPHLKRNCNIWDLKRSPFVYGLDVPHEAYIKDWYVRNGTNSPWNVTMLDLEVNIEDPYNEYITHSSISSETESFLAIARERFYIRESIDTICDTSNGKLDRNGNPYTCDEDIIEDIEYQYKKNVPNGEVTWGEKKREIKLFNTEIEIIEATFEKLHEWKPDIVSIWNMNYDIPKIIKGYTKDIFNKYQVNGRIKEEDIRYYEGEVNQRMGKLFKDPSLPDSLGVFKYTVGSNKIVTVLDDGTTKTKTFKFHEVWHSVKSAASFMVIDAMCLFHQIRSQEPTIDGGMGLENVLNRVVGIGKIKDNSRLVKRLWHIDTSNNKPAFYSCYGMFDTDSMNILDKKTEDLSVTGPAQLGLAHFSKFSALTHRLHLAFHFHIKEDGFVAGTKDPRLKPDPILGIGGGWIVTVPAYRLIGEGGKILKGDDVTNTSHFPHVFDLDEVAAYPRATVCNNVGRETTMGEVIEIKGYTKDVFMKENINLIINKTNAFRYSIVMLGLSGFEKLSNIDVNKPIDTRIDGDLIETRNKLLAESNKYKVGVTANS